MDLTRLDSVSISGILRIEKAKDYKKQCYAQANSNSPCLIGHAPNFGF
jgi:hypothetical protein